MKFDAHIGKMDYYFHFIPTIDLYAREDKGGTAFILSFNLFRFYGYISIYKESKKKSN